MSGRAILSTGLFVAGLPAVVQGADAAGNPLAKVIDLMHELKAKVISDGEAEQKAYHDFFEWCDESATSGHQVIETNTKKKDKLEAQIEDLTSSIDASTTKVEELASAISSAEKELKDATAIRKKEAEQFAVAEKELVSTVDALVRAIAILEKEMSKNPAAFEQLDANGGMNTLVQALSAVVDAAGLSGEDHQRLVALVQAQQGGDDDDDSEGAPAAAAYKSQSGGILENLEDLKEKAETELKETRKAEGKGQFNFKMLSQSLTAETKTNKKHMKDEQASKAGNEEERSTAQGELEVTTKALQVGQKDLATVQASCMTTAADHQASVASRAEELKVIEQATKILEETTSGADDQTYSFVQVSSRSAARADMEVVDFVKGLAKKYHSSTLLQLTSRLTAVARFGADPFAKIKQLIQDMIMKLEKEGQAAATEKAWCDEQMSKTDSKKVELESDLEKMKTKLDGAASRSAQLKSEVSELQSELAALAGEQRNLDRIRQEEHATYKAAKADLELGLGGVRKALDVLRTYYGSGSALVQEQDTAEFNSFMQQPSVPQHGASSGAGGSIINILEVVESDFADNLSKVESEEADAASVYEKVTQENSIAKATMDQDVKYKTQEFQEKDKYITEISADQAASSSELSSVMEYYGEVKDRCIAKPDTFEEKQAKRQAEIDGLKEALQILQNEAAFVQQGRRGSMRGSALEAR